MKKLLSTILTICMIATLAVCNVYANSDFSKSYDFEDFPQTLGHAEVYKEWTGVYSNLEKYPGTTIVSDTHGDGNCVKFTVKNRVELGMKYLGVKLSDSFEIDFSFNRADTNHYWMLSLDDGWSSPIVNFEAGADSNNKISVFGQTLPEVLEMNTWYDVKCFVNLNTKLVTVKVFNGNSLISQIDITYPALPETVENMKFGSHPFGGGSWGQAIPNGASSISFDDIVIKSIPDYAIDPGGEYDFDDFPQTLGNAETYRVWKGVYSNTANYPGTTIVSETHGDGKCVKFIAENRVELGMQYLGVNLSDSFEIDFSFNRADTNHYWMLSLDSGWSSPVVQFQAGGESENRISVFGNLLPKVFETNTWYDVKCFVNLNTKLVTVEVSENGKIVALKDVTYSSLPETVENLKFGSHPFGGGSWGQAIPNGSSSISFDDVVIKPIDDYSVELNVIRGGNSAVVATVDGSDANAALIAAKYSADGALLECNVVEYNEEAGGTQSLEAYFAQSLKDGESAKFMLWDMNNLEPLCSPVIG